MSMKTLCVLGSACIFILTVMLLVLLNQPGYAGGPKIHQVPPKPEDMGLCCPADDPELDCPDSPKIFNCVNLDLQVTFHSDCDPDPQFEMDIDPPVGGFDPDDFVITGVSDPDGGVSGTLDWNADYNMFEDGQSYTLTFKMTQVCKGCDCCVAQITAQNLKTDEIITKCCGMGPPWPHPGLPPWKAQTVPNNGDYDLMIGQPRTCFISADDPDDMGCFQTLCSECIKEGDIDGNWVIIDVSPDFNGDGMPDELEFECQKRGTGDRDCIHQMVVGYYSDTPDPDNPDMNLLREYTLIGSDILQPETCITDTVTSEKACFQTDCSHCIMVGDVAGMFMIRDMAPDEDSNGIIDELEFVCNKGGKKARELKSCLTLLKVGVVGQDPDDPAWTQTKLIDELEYPKTCFEITGPDFKVYKGCFDTSCNHGIGLGIPRCTKEGDTNGDLVILDIEPDLDGNGVPRYCDSPEQQYDIRTVVCTVDFIVEKNTLDVDASRDNFYLSGDVAASGGLASSDPDVEVIPCSGGLPPFYGPPLPYRENCQLGITDIEGQCEYYPDIPGDPSILKPYERIEVEGGLYGFDCWYNVLIICDNCGVETTIQPEPMITFFCDEDCNDNCFIDCWESAFDFECFKIDEIRIDTVAPTGGPPPNPSTGVWDDRFQVYRGSFLMRDDCDPVYDCGNPDDNDTAVMKLLDDYSIIQVMVNDATLAQVYWKDFVYEVPNVGTAPYFVGEENPDASAQGSYVYRWKPGEADPPVFPDPGTYGSVMPSSYSLEIKLNFYKAPDSSDPLGNADAGGEMGEPESPAFWLAGRDAGAWSVDIRSCFTDVIFHQGGAWLIPGSAGEYPLAVQLWIGNTYGIAGETPSVTPGAQTTLKINKYNKVFNTASYPSRYFYKMGLFENGVTTLYGTMPGAGVNANCVIPTICLTEMTIGIPSYLETKTRPGYLEDYDPVNEQNEMTKQHQIGPWITYLAAPYGGNTYVYVWDTSCLYCMDKNSISTGASGEQGRAYHLGCPYASDCTGGGAYQASIINITDDHTVNGILSSEPGVAEGSMCGLSYYLYCDPNQLCESIVGPDTFYYCGTGPAFPDCQGNKTPRRDSPYCKLTLALLEGPGGIELGSDTKEDYDDHPNAGDIDPETTTFTVTVASVAHNIDLDTTGAVEYTIGMEITSGSDTWKVTEVEHGGGIGM